MYICIRTEEKDKSIDIHTFMLSWISIEMSISLLLLLVFKLNCIHVSMNKQKSYAEELRKRKITAFIDIKK